MCHPCFAVARPVLIYKFPQSIFRHGVGALMVSAWLGEVHFETCLHTASVWIECTLASTVLITTMLEVSNPDCLTTSILLEKQREREMKASHIFLPLRRDLFWEVWQGTHYFLVFVSECIKDTG